ncbi:DUF5606 domain-containing protein [Reichenbachiella sp. MALMAid0571]|uniref:DUF5606 family protein n=1 Tax=Reichenbachiella sp. MALMAid0571 TaxID=3143939 RepID=UPI0032DE57DF
MDFNEIATVSGKGGLFKVLAPTKGGMILESLDDQKKKLVVNMHSKVSVLGEISIYTTNKEGSVPLIDVMKKVHTEFKGDIGVTSASDPEELKSFLKFILPDYDESRVYVSDIKKLSNWYNILSKNYPDLFEEKVEEKKEKVKKAKKKVEKKETKKEE